MLASLDDTALTIFRCRGLRGCGDLESTSTLGRKVWSTEVKSTCGASKAGKVQGARNPGARSWAWAGGLWVPVVEPAQKVMM